MKNNKKKLKAPKLRFPEFTDDWEECELGAIYEFLRGKGLALDSFRDEGIPAIAYGHLYTKYIEVINEVNLKSVNKGNPSKKGDILFPSSSTVSNGTCHASALMLDNVQIGSDIIIARAKTENPYAPFISYMINGQRTKLFPITTGTTITHMYGKDIAKLVYFIPKIDEQIRIGQFFEKFELLITLNQNKISHIKDLKAGLLQKMFPKNGETKPEIRFDGFTSDWKKRKLGEVKDVRDGTHDSPKYQNKGFPLITSKNIKESGLDMSNVSLISFEDFNAINQRSKVDIGDIIFGMIGTIGNPIILERDDFAIKNVALLKNGGSIDNRFLLQLLKSPVFELYMKKENAGGTQKFLGLSQIRNLNFLVPELSEQQKIGEFFSQLDNLLTLYKRKVEHLQEQKKSLLKQMFI